MATELTAVQKIRQSITGDPFEKEEIVRQIGAIRLSGHELHKPAGWPHMNISNQKIIVTDLVVDG
jgi:hypothetical protein